MDDIKVGDYYLVENYIWSCQYVARIQSIEYDFANLQHGAWVNSLRDTHPPRIWITDANSDVYLHELAAGRTLYVQSYQKITSEEALELILKYG